MDMFEFMLVLERTMSTSKTSHPVLSCWLVPFTQASTLAVLLPTAPAQRQNKITPHSVFGPFTRNGEAEKRCNVPIFNRLCKGGLSKFVFYVKKKKQNKPSRQTQHKTTADLMLHSEPFIGQQ